jgi:hypothetical protein
LFLFFEVSVDRMLVRVVDYPRFIEENLEKCWGWTSIPLIREELLPRLFSERS